MGNGNWQIHFLSLASEASPRRGGLIFSPSEIAASGALHMGSICSELSFQSAFLIYPENYAALGVLAGTPNPAKSAGLQLGSVDFAAGVLIQEYSNVPAAGRDFCSTSE